MQNYLSIFTKVKMLSATIQGQSFPSNKLLKGKEFPASIRKEVQTLLANSLHTNKSTIYMEKDMIIVLQMHILFYCLLQHH